MRKITNKSPNRLIDMEFNIPIFNADKQMYLCIDVSEIASSPGGKDYNIMLSEVKGLNYSVPERIDISLFIPHTDANGEPAHVIMNEVRPKSDIVLTKVMVTKSKLSSLAGLKEVFYNMAKSI
jgi:hypothetical protein